MKRIGIGLSDFKELVEDNYYYFDKTKFIDEVVKDGAKVKLFTRPRRFGKTLNMSMLKYFFDIKEAEGKAQAILEIQKAEAEAIKILNEAKPTKEILALKSFTTFEKVADGKSTKILIPSEIQNLAGFMQAIKEIK